MFNALQTKLLLIIIALLAGIASYLGYARRKQDVAEKRAQQFARPLRPDEKQAIEDLKNWGKKAREYRPK
jgi:hypothetical protein